VPHDLRVITYDATVAGARRHFLREGTIDMEQLAQELAVSRATLYRAVDGRDRLLGDALWSLAERTYAHARRDVTAPRCRRDPRDPHRFTEAVMTSPPFRSFLEQEPQTALRVLLTPAAYFYVRLRESILYADIMSGRQPDPDVAERAVRALLTAS
jgi:Tetracyclin repressor-like, C-terminal domain